MKVVIFCIWMHSSKQWERNFECLFKRKILSRLTSNTEQLTAVWLSCRSRNTYFPLCYQIIYMWFINESAAWGLMSMLNLLWKKHSPFLSLYPHTKKKKKKENSSVIFYLLCKDIKNWIPPPRMRNVIVKNHRYKLFGCLHHGWERKHFWRHY